MNNTKLFPATCIALACIAVSAQAHAATSTCTTTLKNKQTVNGKALWSEVPTGAQPINSSPCEVDQFSWNNFLYLVSNDSSGKPRFMSFAPWYDALPANGKPVWKGRYTPLSATQLTNKSNDGQAGDNFELVDVNNNVVAYDMRINKTYFDYIAANNLYTKSGIASKVNAYKADRLHGGIWLPPNGGTNQGDSIEIKTAWRDYGPGNTCPSDIMHCEKDGDGNSWGLVGFHLVQKTPSHGEMIWATFEHVANSPDCATNGSNPIQPFPVNPQNNLPPVNANANIPALAKNTGWNFFNYDNYKSAGGSGGNCTYPTSPSNGQALCLTDPNPSGDRTTWLQVNVCRTDQLPQAGAGTTQAGQQASDLNQSVVANFPSGIANKWKYYMLAGSEYVAWGSSGTGAPKAGCWVFANGMPKIDKCPNTGGENAVSRRGTINMANTTMETWMQKGLKLTRGSQTVAEARDCFMCHQPITTNYEGDLSHLFDRVTQAGSSFILKASEKPQKQ